MTRQQARPLPHLLAPGGDLECVKAALLAGADAVYLGVKRFNARMRASNIDEEALEGLTRLAHHHGARILLTMNTLLTEGELGEAVATAERCADRGVDAVIVQDWGLLRALGDRLRHRSPAVEVHASTQMTTHNAMQLGALAAAGVSQVILARELTLEEIRKLTVAAAALGMRTEVFVHGAYCVSVSGQCTMSSTLAGRSGNRGECAQPCRRRYRDERGLPLYPLSLRDCSLFAALPELAASGVAGLKIEGRMKGVDYVTTVVSSYRRALDVLARGETPPRDDSSLHTVFNRGFHDGYFRGSMTRDMFGGEPFDASLSPLGEVRSYRADGAILSLRSPRDLEDGDLLSIVSADRALLVCRLRVAGKTPDGSFRVSIEGELKARITPGCLAYAHPRLEGIDEVRARIARMSVPEVSVDMELSGREGEPLRLIARANGLRVEAQSDGVLAAADRRALDEASLRAALGRLGGTGFELGRVDLGGLGAGLFLPVSMLNELRRRAVALLGAEPEPEQAEGSPEPLAMSPSVAFPASAPVSAAHGSAPELARFGVILSDPAQSDAFRARGATVFMEVKDPRVPFDPGSGIPLFPTIMFDAQVEPYLEVARRPGVRAVVADNVGFGLACAREGLSWIAGPRANVTNSTAVEALRALGAVGGYFYSPELDVPQIRAIATAKAPPGLLMVAGPMLLMTTRQCIVRNLASCRTEVTGDGCVADCRRSAVMRDDGGRPFHVEKRRGTHTEIYNGSMLWYPRAARLLRDLVRCFVLDLRDFSFYSPSLEAKLGMLDRCELAMEGREGPPLRMPMELTRGGFGRGL